MILVGYAEYESDIIRTWDPSTNKVVVTHDFMWHMLMHFQQEGTIGVLETQVASDAMDVAVMAITDDVLLKLGGNVK